MIKPFLGGAILCATLFTSCGEVRAESGPLAQAAATNPQVVDTAPHEVRMIEVEPGVTLEVLDWGGAGEPMVMLTGLGNNAHVFDNFADQFTDSFRVIAITRRGFGASSRPESGYDLATRALDDVKVLDALGLDQVIFVGHSIAGDELSKLGSAYPDRVKKLVYLDAYDYGVSPPPFPTPEFSERDLRSLRDFAAANARFFGHREPEAAWSSEYQVNAAGNIIGPVSPEESSEKVHAGSEPARFDQIQAPVLAILSPLVPEPTFRHYLSEAQKVEFDRLFPAAIAWQDDSRRRFREGVRNAIIVESPGGYHYNFITDEALVVKEMRKFLLPEE
jgi:pimeloyl-ACP methyl ester carboxylesterase